MFDSARKKMPAADYVSIIRSLYDDAISMLYGSMGAAAGAAITGVKTGSVWFYVIAALFVVVGVGRFIDMKNFPKSEMGTDDADLAEKWEVRATVGGILIAGLHGIWCFSSYVVVDDAFAQLSASVISTGVLIGVASRNFGVDRLVTLQAILITAPLATGLVLAGDVYHVLVALILIPFFAGIRRIAGNVRRILIAAVHGRQDAARLARELDTALSTMPHGLCMFESGGRITVINEQTRSSFLGWSTEGYVGRNIAELFDEALKNGSITKAARDCLMSEIHAQEQSKTVVRLNDGRHCEVTIAHEGDNSVLMFEDITERVRSHERISHMARYDGLTQVPNRSFFTEQVQARLSELVGTGQNDTVMMMIIDVDDFKHVNDTYGHPVGDELIVEVARRIRQVVGEDVLLSRFGGDEFMLFRAGVTAGTAEEDAQALLGALRVGFKLGKEVLGVTASIGVVLESADKADIDMLLKRSDLALYKAKASGKARWCLFHDLMDVEYKQRQRLKLELMDALHSGQLYLHYQPIIDLQSGQISGCEALIRWQHPELGSIPPMQFIPIAEEIGAMSDISRFVLESATRECGSWPDHMNVSVNLSATDFRSVSVQDMVQEALAKTGLAPERLIVEITETALIEEPHKAAQALAALRETGIGIALDDFGTGYSSLSYLHAMSFTKLKIDRSFVVDVTTNDRARKLMINIAQLSRDLDMTVTVEGVETEEQLEVITQTGMIDHAQGYLFGAPLPASDIHELIRRTSGQKLPEALIRAAAS